MNKYKNQLKASLDALKRHSRQHVHVLASTACGVLMGILFVSEISSYEAKRPRDIPYGYYHPFASYLSEPLAPETIRPAAPAPRIATVDVAVATSSSSSSSSSSTPEPTTQFPAFERTSWPVAKAPNWGAMRSPAEWNRTYDRMTANDFVPIPRYNLSQLTIPMSELTNPISDETIPIITAKLFYSTRYLGSYDLDAGEHTGGHAGIDLKLAQGTPIGAIAGGRVSSVRTTDRLGLHVILEHRLGNGETYYSVYAHLDSTSLTAGDDVRPGRTVGLVGMTGQTSAPHLHLQIDTGNPGEDHVPSVSPETMVHPIRFLTRYRNGE